MFIQTVFVSSDNLESKLPWVEALDKTPWRIGTLKYLEVKIEEWPSRAKWGQAGPNRSKWCQMVPNGAKQGQTGSNGAKKGQKGPTEPNGAQKGKWGQTRPNGVIWVGSFDGTF